MNSLHVIAPYKYEGMWVFDHERVGLVQEPFPGHTLKFDWVRPEWSGNVYRASGLDMEGWLCPALFKYFTQAPPELYVKVEPKAVQTSL